MLYKRDLGTERATLCNNPQLQQQQTNTLPRLRSQSKPRITSMASLKCIILLVVLALAMAAAFPAPDPIFFGPKHEHVVIHVPYHVHTVHHHSIHKIPVYLSKGYHGWD